MTYGLFHTAKPFTQILLVLFLMVTSYLIFFGLGILLAMPIFKVSPSEVIAMVENKDILGNINLLKFLQVLYSIGLFLVPAILAGYLIQRNAWKYLRVNNELKIFLVLLVILLMIVSIPWINYLGYLNEQLSLPERWSELMEKIRQNDQNSWDLMKSYLAASTVGGLFFNLFMVALIPAIGEEFLFRGVLQRIFTRWFKNGHLAVWLAAILFSLAHYQFLGFIPRILLGALFGYLFLWSRNIWIPVIAHFVNNAVGVVYYYLYLKGSLRTDPAELGMQQNPVLFVMGSVVFTIVLLIVIDQFAKSPARIRRET